MGSQRAWLRHPLFRLLVMAAAILAAAIAPAAAQAAETGVGTDLASPTGTLKEQDRTATALRGRGCPVGPVDHELVGLGRAESTARTTAPR